VGRLGDWNIRYDQLGRARACTGADRVGRRGFHEVEPGEHLANTRRIIDRQ